MSIEQTLENVSSYVDRLQNSFNGTFEILNNQLIHLNDHSVIINEKEFKIVSNQIEPKIITYDIETSRLRYYNSEVLPSIQIKLLSMTQYNFTPNDTVPQLLNNVLYMTPPTRIYITQHGNDGLYSVKNMNMATLFLMRKISNAENSSSGSGSSGGGGSGSGSGSGSL
jgi:uncharacterized membrane protein YgcG